MSVLMSSMDMIAMSVSMANKVMIAMTNSLLQNKQG